MYGAITHYGQTFQTVPLFTHQSAGPRSLVATEGVSIDFLSSGYLDISVPRVRLATLCIQVTIPLMRWVSPFGNPRLKAYLSAPRGLSQTYTSFIAFCRQGIHHVRLVTWSYNPKPSGSAFFPDSALDHSLAWSHGFAMLPSTRSSSALIREKIPSPDPRFTIATLYKRDHRKAWRFGVKPLVEAAKLHLD